MQQIYPTRKQNDIIKSDSTLMAIRLFRIMSIPTTYRLFRVLTSEMFGIRLPVYTLLLRQRRHIIVVDAVDYCNFSTHVQNLICCILLFTSL